MESPLSPFYRVTVKAVVRDNEGRVLVVQAHEGWWEMPGGGLEFEESVEECLKREFQEELGVGVGRISEPWAMFRAKNIRGFIQLRLIVDASVSGVITGVGADMQATKYVTQAEFLALEWAQDEQQITQFADRIWQ